jgi:hypothetical protein
VQDQFNAELEQRNSHTVWATGCRSWYLDRFGKNRTMWPASTVAYWRRTRRLDPAHVQLDVERPAVVPTSPDTVAADAPAERVRA